ncbi:tetratricopeptide repeat protein [candidate division KSB1 bacterium]|nr:tetratricopeptide repeat protein [candidate division KSB1 bacterium]
MYFIVLNLLLGCFFLFLIIVGIILKYWSYLPVNAVGILVVGTTLYLDIYRYLSAGNIIILLLMLLILFVINIIFVFRDFKEEITRIEAIRRKKYLTEGMEKEYFKLIKDESLIKNEIDKFKKIPMQERTHAFEMLAQGNKTFIQQNYVAALEKYKLSTNWVQSSIGFVNQSGVLLKIGQFKNALIFAEKASEISSRSYEALLNQAIALEKLKQNNKALLKYEAAAKISPKEYEIWYCCANILFKMKKYKNAIEYYSNSLNLYGNQFDAWYYKGISFQKTREIVEALHCFEQAIKLKSNHGQTHFRMGNILSRLDRNENALSSYEKAIRINSKSAETWNNLGITLNKMGRNKDANKCFDRAIRLNSEYYEAWLNKGLTLETMGKYKKAYLSFKKFLELAPDKMEKQRTITQNRVIELQNKYKINLSKDKKRAKKLPNKTR